MHPLSDARAPTIQYEQAVGTPGFLPFQFDALPSGKLLKRELQARHRK